MKTEDLINAQNNIREIFENKTDELNQIKESKSSISSRWQKFIELIIPLQFSEIRKLMYPGNQDGLSKFSIDLMEASKTDLEIRQLNEGKWKFLLQHAFGITEFKQVTLEKAQQMVKEIAEGMQVGSFLLKVDALVTPDYLKGTMIEKRNKLFELLTPVYINVFKNHGLEGENGYILGQRALMDYYSDPFIKGYLNSAQFHVFSRAKLI